MTKRISNARYGGLDDAELSRVCTLLVAVAAKLPTSDDIEVRRKAGAAPQQIALQLARADPKTPLSDALYGLVAAIDFYVHFRADVGPARSQLLDVLERTMRHASD